MAVKTKKATSVDKSNGRHATVNYAALTKGNKKGFSELVGGELLPGDTAHDFYVKVLVTNAKMEYLFHSFAVAGTIGFRTGNSKRWQYLSRVEFKKRFPEIKL